MRRKMKGVSDKGRSCAGQGLAEAAAGVVLIGLLLIGGVLLIVCSALATYYKTKVAHAAETGARYASETVEWLGAPRPYFGHSLLRRDVTEVVGRVLSEMGLPAPSAVVVTRSQAGGKKFVRVSVTVKRLRLISGGILPASIDVTESCSSCVGNMQPPAVLGMTLGGHGIYLPSFGSGANLAGPSTYPLSRTAYYAGSVAGAISGIQGPFQNTSYGGQFQGY